MPRLPLQDRMPLVDQIIFHANGSTLSLMVGADSLPIGLDGVDHKLIVGPDVLTQRAIIQLMEHITGHHFELARRDQSIMLYRRCQ